MRFLILLSAVLLSACGSTQSHLAYITNQGDNTVSVINMNQLAVTHAIKVGKAPVGVATSAALQRVFISNVDSQNISVIDSRTQQVVDTITINGSPVGIAIAPNNKT